jgi:dolichol-phosphate mannosyltransferase
MSLEISIVIPVYNEEANIQPLVAEIAHAFKDREYEIILVDDCSDDGTWALLRRLRAENPRLRAIRHSRRCGQSTAIYGGVKAARAAVVGTLDGDGQNDPSDLDALLHALRQANNDARSGASNGAGLEVAMVAGWRTQRKDSAVKLMSSRIANSVRRNLLRDGTPDTGCGIKVFYRDVFISLPYFDHMHRFLPALVQRTGRTVISVPVKHRARLRGKSKYGVWNRLWVGIVDLLGVAWLIRRSHRPSVEELP